MPLSTSSSTEKGTAKIDLTNPYLRLGKEVVYQGNIHVRRLLALQDNTLTERIYLTSFHGEPITLKLGLKIGADYRDIFEVRGMSRGERGEVRQPRVTRDGVTLSYQ